MKKFLVLTVNISQG